MTLPWHYHAPGQTAAAAALVFATLHGLGLDGPVGEHTRRGTTYAGFVTTGGQRWHLTGEGGQWTVTRSDYPTT